MKRSKLSGTLTIRLSTQSLRVLRARAKKAGRSTSDLEVGPATLIATVYTNWGRPDERREVLTLRLDAPRELEQVGVVHIGAGSRGER